MTSYKAQNGRVYARVDGEWIEAATALTAQGRDLEKHDAALQTARAQRALIAQDGIRKERERRDR